MFKRISLFGLIGVLLLLGVSVYAGEVKLNCEIGDAIFRPLTMPLGIGNGFGHVGIYCCSQSDKSKVSIGTEDPYPIQIDNSDFKYSMIQVNGYKKDLPPDIKEIDFVTLEFALDGRKPWGAYSNGRLLAKDRRQIIATAYKQTQIQGTKYVKYATGDPKKNEKPEDIKKPDVSFRCDGFVEYCYEQVVGGFFSDEEERDCWSSLLDKKYAGGIWPKFYPKALMELMQEAKAVLPQVKFLKVYKPDGTEVGKNDWIMAGEKYTVKIQVTDETKEGLQDGSGIDKVELFCRIRIPNEEKKIGEEDKDEDIGKIYEFDWTPTITTVGNSLYELFVQTYDRAGNKTLVDNSKFVYGSPYTAEDPFPTIVDNKPPQVLTTAPLNNATKIYIDKKIKITFSEKMDDETINRDTILVNNGSVVGSVTYNEDLKTAFFTPDKPLDINTNYTVLVKAGLSGVKDTAGNPIASDDTFSFTTTNELVPDRVIELAVTYTNAEGKEHPVPAGTRVMTSFWLRDSGVETYIIGTAKWYWVEQDGKVRFNWPGGNLDEQRFRVFFESWGFRTDRMTPDFWVLTDPITNSISHTLASELFDIHKPIGSDVYVPIGGTITIHYNQPVSIPWWNKVYFNRTGALHSLGAFNHGFEYITTHNQGINPVDYASWMEDRDYTPEGITCYGTNTAGKWRILVNGIERDEWSEDKLLSAFGNLLVNRYGKNYNDFQLTLKPKFGRRADVFQSWLNGFSHYYSCLARGTATIEVRDIDTGVAQTYNLELLGSETRGLDNEAAIAAGLWKMKDSYGVWKAVNKASAVITPAHTGYNTQDFWQEIGTQSYISMPEQIWLEHGLMPKIKSAIYTDTPKPHLFWDRNSILDNSISLTYTLEIATNTTFTNPIFTKNQIAVENYRLTDINLDDGIYYWRVRVEDEYLTGNLQNALPKLYSPIGSFEIHLPKKAAITVISDPNTQGIPSDVIVAIYDTDGSIYTGGYWVDYDQANQTKVLDLRYSPITVHFEAEGGNAVVPPDYLFTNGSCVHMFEKAIIFTEPGTYSVRISMTGENGEGLNIPAVSHSGIKAAPKGIIPDHFHVVDILDSINEGEASNVSMVVHDAGENLVIGYIGSVYFTSTDPRAMLPQTYTFTASDYGVNTFVDGVVLKTAGTQTVFVRDVNNLNITGSQTVFVNMLPSNVFVTPSSGTVGTPVTVSGSGFGPNEYIWVGFGTALCVKKTMSDASGSFTTSFAAQVQFAGETTVTAYGLSSSRFATSSFTLQPFASPLAINDMEAFNPTGSSVSLRWGPWLEQIDTRREIDVRRNLNGLKAAITLYYKENGKWPESLDSTAHGSYPAFIPKYFNSIPYATLKRQLLHSRNKNVLIVPTASNEDIPAGSIDDSGGWIYSKDSGDIRINCRCQDMEAIWHTDNANKYPHPGRTYYEYGHEGDDGFNYYRYYDIRYSSAPTITESNWESLPKCPGVRIDPYKQPFYPYSEEYWDGFLAWDMATNTTYYLAARVQDQTGQWSGISGIASVTTFQADGSRITDLAVSTVTPTAALLKWTAPTLVNYINQTKGYQDAIQYGYIASGD